MARPALWLSPYQIYLNDVASKKRCLNLWAYVDQLPSWSFWMWRLTQRPSKTHGKVWPSSSLTFEFPNFQQAGVFMGFSITSAVFGGIIIISYSFGIVSITTFDYGIYDYSYRHGNYYHYRTKVTILAIMFVLGLVTFGTGIWAATCTCLMKPCTACWGQPQVSSPSTFTSSLYSSWTKKWTCTNLLTANM